MNEKKKQHFRESFTVMARIGVFLVPQLVLYIPALLIWTSQDFVMPYFLARLQERLTEFALGVSASGFLHIVLRYVLALSVYLVIFCFTAYLVMVIQEQSKCRLWNRCFQKLLRAKKPMKTDDAVIRFSNDVTTAAISTYGTISSLLQGFIALIGSLAVVLKVHWILGLTAVLIGLLNVWIKRHFVGKFRIIGQELREAEAGAQSEVTDNIANKIAVRLFLLAGRRNRELGQRLEQITQVNRKKVSLDTHFGFLTYCRKWMTYGGVCLMGGLLIYQGQLTLPALILALGVLPQVVMKIGFLIDIVAMYQASLPACSRVIEMLDMEEEAAGVSLLETSPRILTFEHVSFRYPGGEKDVLHDVSFTLRKGEKLALVGSSGNGKSTLLKLAVGTLRPDSGRIFMDGVSLEEADPCQWRHCFGYVDQSADLLPGTIRENVGMGKEGASDQEIGRALDEAGIADFVSSRSLGLDTPIEGGKATLSGGQKQRIALARALLRRGKILCLDEITSAQDTSLRKEMTALFFQDGLTVLAATNDPAFARSFDRTLTLENGTLQ